MNWDHPYILEKQSAPKLDSTSEDAADDSFKNLPSQYYSDIKKGITGGLDTWGRNFKETRARIGGGINPMTGEYEKGTSSWGRAGADAPLWVGGLGLGALALGGLKMFLSRGKKA